MWNKSLINTLKYTIIMNVRMYLREFEIYKI